MKKVDILKNGIWKMNPVLTMMLGLCPVLAVTTSLENALGMGLATFFVLFFSNTIIASVKNLISDKIRLPCYIVIIATFVTIVSLILQAYFPSLFDRLGIYVPLIVVNCIILSRAEIFARKNPVTDSMVDAIGMGIGFTIALSLIGIAREILGTASVNFAGLSMALPSGGALIIVLPPGALFTIGFILAAKNYHKQLQKEALNG